MSKLEDARKILTALQVPKAQKRICAVIRCLHWQD